LWCPLCVKYSSLLDIISVIMPMSSL
jgi:hypothetical protein